MANVFSVGRLVYNGLEVGTLAEFGADHALASIPLPSNMRAPLKNASGRGKLTGSAKLNAFDPSFIATVTNAAMAAASAEVALTWYVTDTAGTITKVEMPNVALSGIKLSAGMDKWLSCDLSWEAACAGGTGSILTRATVGSIPALDPITSKWVFSTGSFVLQGNTIGNLADLNLDITLETIPLESNYRYPLAIATGPIKVSGATKFNQLDTNFIPATMPNVLMAAPTSDLAAVWTFVDSAAASHVITLPAVTLTGWKANGGQDKWFGMDVTFEAAAAIADANIIEVT